MNTKETLQQPTKEEIKYGANAAGEIFSKTFQNKLTLENKNCIKQIILDKYNGSIPATDMVKDFINAFIILNNN